MASFSTRPSSPIEQDVPVRNQYELRRATPDDYDAIIRVVDDWWGRSIAKILPRLFLDHFFATSSIVESDGEMVAFLIAFFSPSRADQAYIHFVGVHPSHRTAGLARRLYEDFFARAAQDGRVRVSAITGPVNTGSIAFHERMGFSVRGPVADYNQPGTAHMVFERPLTPTVVPTT
jgi:ribosomal protein S18 acetylase RimI-like enzyme